MRREARICHRRSTTQYDLGCFPRSAFHQQAHLGRLFMRISDEAACILARVVSFFYQKNKDTPKQTHQCNYTPINSELDSPALATRRPLPQAQWQGTNQWMAVCVGLPGTWPRLSGGCASVTCRTPAGRNYRTYRTTSRYGNTTYSRTALK